MKLNYTEIFESAWHVIRDNLALVAGLTAVFMAGVFVLNRFSGIGSVLTGPLTAGYIQCLLQIRRGQTINYEDLLWGFLKLNRFVHLVLMTILISAGTAIGMFLLVIPGIWWMVSTLFAMTLFLLKKEDAIDSIMKSIELVQQRWFNVFGFMICLMLIVAAGAACLGIGLLIALPVAALSVVIAMESLQENSMFTPMGSSFSSERTTRSE